MDEYLSEKEQLDRLLGWLRANIPWIVVGLACGGLIVYGIKWWQARTDRNGVEASQSYAQVLDAASSFPTLIRDPKVQELGLLPLTG